MWTTPKAHETRSLGEEVRVKCITEGAKLGFQQHLSLMRQQTLLNSDLNSRYFLEGGKEEGITTGPTISLPYALKLFQVEKHAKSG